MRRLFILMVLGLVALGCSNEENPIQDNGVSEEVSQDDEDGMENSGNDQDDSDQNIDLSNITDFTVEITGPEDTRDFTFHNQGSLGIFQNPNENLFIEGRVDIMYDNNSSPIPSEEIDIKWYSEIDGLMSEGHPDNLFRSTVQKPLSKNIHKVFFEASISGDEVLIARDSIIFSNVLSLELEPTEKSIKLSWSRYEMDDFISYVIYRGGNEPIVEIFDQDSLEFEDRTMVLAEESAYQVVVNTQNESIVPAGSNIAEDEAGNYIEIPYYIAKAVYDQTRNKVYAIIGSSFNQSIATAGLMIIDNTGETFSIESHLLQDLRFADLDMSPDSQYLFLCRKGTDAITRLDLNSLESVDFQFVNRGVGIHKIEVGNDYRVYGHENPTFGGPLHFFNGLTGEYLGINTVNNLGLWNGDIEFNIYNNKLYHGTSQREKSVYRFGVENDMLNREDDFSPNIGWPTPFILLSDNGQHIFWENFELDTELNVVRELENSILACSPNNQYVSNGLSLLKYEDLDVIFDYPFFPSHDFSGEMFTNTGDILIYKSSQPYTNQRFTHFFKMRIE